MAIALLHLHPKQKYSSSSLALAGYMLNCKVVSLISNVSSCNQGQRRAQFTFDRIFDGNATQDDLYEYAARPIVEG